MLASVEGGTADATYRRAVGKRIRVWRVLHDRSQDELAAAAGVTRNFVSAIERGAQGLDAVRLRPSCWPTRIPVGATSGPVDPGRPSGTPAQTVSDPAGDRFEPVPALPDKVGVGEHPVPVRSRPVTRRV